MLHLTSLNSGSNGNCYYIGNDREAVLVDAGISCRETEKRMKRLGLSMEKVKAIFVSHEHSDHIRGIPVLARKYGLPVYITPTTQLQARMETDGVSFAFLQAYQPVQIGGLSLTAFPKNHDAADPHSFVVSGGGVQVGVFTDIGSPCDHLIRHFSQCHAVILEANYDEGMLEQGSYPYHLKRRIRGGKGHLSNRQALDLFTTCRSEFLRLVVLGHLSRDNNNPTLVHSLFSLRAGGAEIVVASRYAETAVFTVSSEPGRVKAPVVIRAKPVQLQIAEFFPPL